MKVFKFTRTSTAKKQGKGEASNQLFKGLKTRMIANNSTYYIVKGIDNGATFGILLNENGKFNMNQPFRLVPVYYCSDNNPLKLEAGYYIDMHRLKSEIFVEECEIVEI